MRILIIPAAGRGSRLGADVPKPLVAVAGRTMLDRLADLYAPFVDGIVVVTNGDTGIEAWARRRGAVAAQQAAPTGMLDAILLAAPAIQVARPDRVWITWADQIGVLAGTIGRLAECERTQPEAALIVPTARRSDPYIHFERDASSRLTGLLQRREGDLMPREGEGDIGVFAMAREAFETDLREYAATAPRGGGTGERNFLPFIPWLAQRKPVATFPCLDPMEGLGINTPEDLRRVEAWLESRAE